MDNFLYNITINQYAIIKHGLDIDIDDASIFAYIEKFALSNASRKMHDNGKTYFWLKWDKILSDMPMIARKIKTRQGVYKRFANLKDALLIEAHPDNQIQGQSWYCFGVNFDLMHFTSEIPVNEKLHPVNESLQTCKQEFTPPVNESLHNNSILDNTINNNTSSSKKTKKVFLAETVEELFKNKKASTLFESVYVEEFAGIRYNFTSRDFKALKSLLAKLYEAVRKKSKKDEVTQEELLDAFDFFLRSAAKDSFVKKAYFTIVKLDLYFQEVINKIILNATGTNTAASSELDAERIASL